MAQDLSYMQPLCVGFRRGKIGQRLRCKNYGRPVRITGEFGGYVLVLCEKCIDQTRDTGWKVEYVELKAGKFIPGAAPVA